MKQKFFKSVRQKYLFSIVAGVTLALGLAALLTSIAQRREAGKHTLPDLAALSDDDVSPESWGRSFPAQLSAHLSMKNGSPETFFGGGLPYSRLIRFPQLTRLWAGYPFAIDFNEERSHAYAQLDQVETKRNNKEWLNSHGFPNFKGQPGACMNCHSGWTPQLIGQLGWEKFNETPYVEIKKILDEKHGPGLHGADLGGTCADCHSPKDMSLRVTRPAYVNAMVIRGYKANSEHGIEATPQEMRSHVCQQCHVEYYFKGDKKELTFPWALWPKDKPLRIEMVEQYYEKAKESKVFLQDWTHKETGAPMLKAQHPETELNSSGVHAQSGVSCADCHMPYVRDGARKITDHNIKSPLLNIRESCQTCHPSDSENIMQKVAMIQGKTAEQLRLTEGAILALADDIAKAKLAIEKNGKKEKEDEILKTAREAHRKSSFRWDFIASENSTGFHSPQESSRVLGLALDSARQGQLLLIQSLKKENISIDSAIVSGTIPPPMEPYSDIKNGVGVLPPQKIIKCDSDLLNSCYTGR